MIEIVNSKKAHSPLIIARIYVEVELFLDAVYKVLLVSYFKVKSFSFTCEVEFVSGLGPGVHEIAGMFLSDAGSSDSDDIVIDLFGNR